VAPPPFSEHLGGGGGDETPPIERLLVWYPSRRFVFRLSYFMRVKAVGSWFRC